MTFHIWLAYFITDFSLSLTPGPAVMLVSSQGIQRGWRASCFGALGIVSANLIFFICSALGLSAALLRAETVFAAIKICGAAYLIFIAAAMIVHSFKETYEFSHNGIAARAGIDHPFFQAFVTQISNPKAIIFFASLVPQFIDPNGSMLLQFSIIAATGIIPETFILIGYGWLGAHGHDEIKKRPALGRWIDRGAASILLFIGIQMLAGLKILQ